MDISVLGWVLISLLERAADSVGDAIVDTIRKKSMSGKKKMIKRIKHVMALLFIVNLILT